jgi:hypothetical protein
MGLTAGFLQIGSATWRTIETVKGNVLNVIAASVVISISFYFGIAFVIESNFAGYVGFSIGACAATALLAHSNKGLIKIDERD